MQGRETTRISVYLDGRRSSDRLLLSKLRADRNRRSMSATLRLALEQYYNACPALSGNDALRTVAEALAQLQTQMAQFAQLTAQLQAQVTALSAENQQLRQLLLAATFGDRASKQAAERAALALVRVNDNGNGRA